MNADRGGVAVGHLEYQRAPVPGRPVRLLPRPAFLAGREELLHGLHMFLGEGGDAGSPRFAVLHGLGGCGKTSVALEYAYRHLTEFGIIWQFAAEEPAALAAGFGDLAAQLGVRGLLEMGDPVAQVHAVLAAHPGRWLLLFDNAPNLAAVRPFLPPAGNGCVLVTSQDPTWPGRHLVEVPALDLDTAVLFLRSRTGGGDSGAARELAAELGGLPLALEQAAAYMEATGRSLPEYLELLLQSRPALLARGHPDGYGKRVASTWQLAFDRLRENAPHAVALLRLLACCAPEQIPVRLLLWPGADFGSLPPELLPLLDDPLEVDDALVALRRYSLTSPPQGGKVSVHRLVQAVTLDSLPAAEADMWREATRAIISAALPTAPEKPLSWPAYFDLFPHAEAALLPASDGMARIATFLGHIGNYAAARDLYRRIAAAKEESLGPEHPETLDALAALATWVGQAGDAVSARDQFAALLPVRERVLGPEHPDTLIDRANVAHWTGEAGDAVSARDQIAALLPVWERVSGPEHPDTPRARASLAYWTGEAGDAASARDQYAALLPVRERVLGPEHPDTLIDRANVAHWTGRAGDVVSARDQYAALLPVRERVLGPEHPHILSDRANLATWTGRAGDAVSARDQYAALLPIRERVSGPEHPETLTARANFAYWTREAGG